MRVRHRGLIATGLALAALLAACGSTTSTAPRGDAAATSANAAVAAEASAEDIAFTRSMIPHHAQAVEMADMALSKSDSPEVRLLATKIKDAQGPEITMMGDWLSSWNRRSSPGGLPHADESGTPGLEHDMPGMDENMPGMDHDEPGMGMMSADDMDALAAAQGPAFDRMWLERMIEHHQGAIAMADSVLTHSSNPDVVALAKAVASGQAGEIQTMRTLLAG